MNLTRYESPLGSLLLAAGSCSVQKKCKAPQLDMTGLWFVGQKYFPSFSDGDFFENETPVLTEAKHWLSLYFSGKEPDFLPSLHPQGSSFRQAVWNVLLTIPRGQTMTYGEIARRLNVRSAQAVGGAVGHNPISILIPCHRVVGSDGSLTGYAGGLARKEWLLHLEGAR